MTVRRYIRVIPLLAMLGCAGTAGAEQLYKWVDERGVTNYSNQPPARTVKQRAIENRVSVYTPDPEIARATQAERARAIEDIRTGRRSQEIQADWLARQYLAAAQQGYAVDPCTGSADPRCTGYAPYGYAPAGAYLASRRLRILPQIQLTPGTIAGNVTGNSGIIPGLSGFATPASRSRPRAVMEAARNNGGDGGGSRSFGGGHRR